MISCYFYIPVNHTWQNFKNFKKMDYDLEISIVLLCMVGFLLLMLVGEVLKMNQVKENEESRHRFVVPS